MRKYVCSLVDVYKLKVFGCYIDEFQYPSNTIVLYWSKEYEPNEYMDITDGDLLYIQEQKEKKAKEIKLEW